MAYRSASPCPERAEPVVLFVFGLAGGGLECLLHFEGLSQRLNLNLLSPVLVHLVHSNLALHFLHQQSQTLVHIALQVLHQSLLLSLLESSQHLLITYCIAENYCFLLDVFLQFCLILL